MYSGKTRHNILNIIESPAAINKFEKKLLLASLSFFCPIYCETIIPAAAAIADRSTEYIDENFAPSPTPAILLLPSFPIISWSITPKDDCSNDCNVTGKAIPATFL